MSLGTLLPYQRELVAAPDRFVALSKGRRLGGSHAAAMRHALRFVGLRLGADGRMELGECTPQLVTSASEDQAFAVLATLRAHAEALGAAVEMVDPGRTLDPHASSRGVLALRNGTEARAFSSSPRSLRGFEGDLLWDEAAFSPDPERFWRAAKSCVDATIARPMGYALTALSTPWAAGSLAHRILVGDGTEGDSFRHFRRFEWTASECILRGGFPDPSWSPERRAEYLEALRRETDPESFAVEYEGSWLSADGLFFAAELLARACYQPSELPREGELVAGVDVGRVADKFAIVRMLRDPAGVVWILPSETMARASFDAQEARVAQALDTEGVRQVAIDATGMGAAPAERLERRYRGRVRGTHITVQIKENAVTTLRLALEQGMVRLPAGDASLLRDLSRIQRHIGTGGTVTFKSPRDATGHGDVAWAALLGWRLARASPAANVGVRCGAPRTTASWRAHLEAPDRRDFDDPAAYFRASRGGARGGHRAQRRRWF